MNIQNNQNIEYKTTTLALTNYDDLSPDQKDNIASAISIVRFVITIFIIVLVVYFINKKSKKK